TNLCGNNGTVVCTPPSPGPFYPGTTTVHCVATDTNTGCSASCDFTVTVVSQPPWANFTSTTTTGPAPLQVIFTDNSTGTIASVTWTFGDGHAATNAAPTTVTNTYSAAGHYSVTQIVDSASSCGISTNGQPNLIWVLTAWEAWQQQYFNCIGCAQAAANADPDGDGMSNTNEFLAGFNATNSAAYLHIISIARTNNDMRVTYLGANGDSTYPGGPASRTNVLEFTTGTANGSYTNNFVNTGQTNVLSGGTGLGVITNMVEVGGATNAPARYYRVRVLVP
ncbi:MAG: PKD domain-containing protein, partial [Verrucomicrobiia bacterium]